MVIAGAPSAVRRLENARSFSAGFEVRKLKLETLLVVADVAPAWPTSLRRSVRWLSLFSRAAGDAMVTRPQK
jgi:hypothetical protein